MRALVGTPLNAGISLACLVLLGWAAPPLLRWGVLDAAWSGGPAGCAAVGGACWAYVGEKLGFFLFGFYPAAERWRPFAALVLLLALMGASLVPRCWRWGLVAAWPVTLGLVAWLLGGGAGMAEVPSEAWSGLPLTVLLASFALVAAFPLGVLLALGRASRLPFFRVASTVFIELPRGLPLVSVLFMASVMLPLLVPAGATPTKLVRAWLAFTVVAAAFIAEIVRGGLQAVPAGQSEAATALGLGYWRRMRLVVLPQCLRISVPALVGVAISFFKDTSLVTVIGLSDLLGAVNAGSRDPAWLGHDVEGYAFAAAVYFAFCFGASRYAAWLERRLRGEARAVRAAAVVAAPLPSGPKPVLPEPYSTEPPHMTHTSARMAQFRPSPTGAMSALVRRLRAEGRDIIGLVGGEPDFATPEPIKQAGIRAIMENNTRYTDVDGTPALRAALSEKFKRENGLDYKPDQIVVTSGTKPLLHAALLAMTDPGDEVIIPAPHWVSHPDISRIAGAVPVIVACPPETGFRLAPEALEAAITPRTRVLILNSPNNPTGTAYTEEDLRAIIAVLKRHPDVWVLTDEIYEHIRFDGAVAPSIGALDPTFTDRVVTANGFSKGYVMTGWRVGFAGGPPEMMKAIRLIVGQLLGSPSAISQAAAIEALTGDQEFIRENATVFQERRDIALQVLQQTPGLRCHTPEGAFYLFADCSGAMGKRLPDGKVIETDTDFVLGSIEHAGVALVPGSAFGLSPFFRLSYSLETSQLRVAMERLAAVL